MSEIEGGIEYADWGELFFAHAVTLDRVLAGVNVMADRPIEVGPLGVGPGRLAKVHASGRIGTATGQRYGDLPIRFLITLPVQLRFMLDLTMDKQHFDAELEIPLTLTARARDDLAIVIDVAPPSTDEVVVRLKARGLRASLLGSAAGIENELRRFVAKYVAREVAKPDVVAACTIDVAAAVDRAAGGVVPQREGETA